MGTPWPDPHTTQAHPAIRLELLPVLGLVLSREELGDFQAVPNGQLQQWLGRAAVVGGAAVVGRAAVVGSAAGAGQVRRWDWHGLENHVWCRYSGWAACHVPGSCSSTQQMRVRRATQPTGAHEACNLPAPARQHGTPPLRWWPPDGGAGCCGVQGLS